MRGRPLRRLGRHPMPGLGTGSIPEICEFADLRGRGAGPHTGSVLAVVTPAPSVLITTEGGPMALDLAALRLGPRLPASWGEVERCRVWQLDAFGRSERTGDAALQTYIVALVVEVWHPLSRLLKPWRRWPPWLNWVKLENLPKNGRLPGGFWHVGYRARRGPRRSTRHRRVRVPPPLVG